MLTCSKIGFIGGGAMAEALLKGILRSSLLSSNSILVSDISSKRLHYLQDQLKIQPVSSNTDVASECDIVFLAVKPQMMEEVLADIRATIRKEALIVSIAAGISLTFLKNALPQGMRIVRVMPNTPALVGAGVSAIASGRMATENDIATVKEILHAVGQVVEVSEAQMDAVTGLSGSGPAYGFMMIEALADGGVLMGLPRSTALTLAAQTLLGAAQMVLDTGEHPGKLKDMVCSPAGTTIAAVQVLEKAGLRGALIDAVQVSAKRSHEMGTKPKGE